MAVKRLLRQTLSHDDEMIDVHPLAELILSEGVRLGSGSSIKTDGEESDPWGLVGVVDISKHRVGPALILTSIPSLSCSSSGFSSPPRHNRYNALKRYPPVFWPSATRSIGTNTNRQENPALKPFLEYLTKTLPSGNPIRMLLEPSISPAMASRPALIFSLRLLNLPLPLIPPLYKMLLDELKTGQGQEQGEFTHWILWGRGYRLEGGEEGMGLDMQIDG
jgi:protein BCP1